MRTCVWEDNQSLSGNRTYVLLDTHIQLADGVRVRIRLPHSSDRPGLEALHARTSPDGSEIDAARLLRFDLRRETVICASTWVGLIELLVGYGVIEHDAGAPHVLVCD